MYSHKTNKKLVLKTKYVYAFSFFICIVGPQTQECPASHPYAYNYGTHCCQFGSEGAGCNKFPDQEACDGSLLTQASRSCKYNARFRCPDLCINKGMC